MAQDLWYSAERLMSHNALFNFVVGGRGGGKSFDFKRRAARLFLKKGKQFVYVRRNASEFDNLNNYWSDLLLANYEEFEGHTFYVEGNIFYIDGEVAGYAIALSTADKLKSNSYPLVELICFDEFMKEKTTHSGYIKNEVQIFLNLYETIARLRRVVVLFISNSVSINNPYFDHFGIRPKRGSKFTTIKHEDGTPLICIEMYYNKAFAEYKAKTDFGKLIEGTAFSEYAIENKFINDNYTWVEPMKARGKYLFTIKFKCIDMGVWEVPEKGILHITSKTEPLCKSVYAFDVDSHTPNVLLIRKSLSNHHFKYLRMAFESGLLRFDKLQIKTAIIELLDY